MGLCRGRDERDNMWTWRLVSIKLGITVEGASSPFHTDRAKSAFETLIASHCSDLSSLTKTLVMSFLGKEQGGYSRVLHSSANIVRNATLHSSRSCDKYASCQTSSDVQVLYGYYHVTIIDCISLEWPIIVSVSCFPSAVSPTLTPPSRVLHLSRSRAAMITLKFASGCLDLYHHQLSQSANDSFWSAPCVHSHFHISRHRLVDEVASSCRQHLVSLRVRISRALITDNSQPMILYVS